MPPVVSFIGWHNSGKTTLARQVVARLKEKGYTVAVIKSTKERDIVFDQPHTDTGRYWVAGADSVALLAPDQLIVRSKPLQLDLPTMAQRLFPDADIVIAEGFKQAAGVPKIEVRRDATAPLLRDRVSGVIAVVTDLPLANGPQFRLDGIEDIADLIEARFLSPPSPLP